uniref:Uncharacterized protein n=1 Tax=Hyaloperonospora arabidopsidis (strain Emoy2) TaxID=559515 RepID=M4BIZ9_HYAAE
MVRKSSNTRPRRAISALVRAEDAAEDEILQTPALSSIAVADRGHNSESDDDNDNDTAEAEAAIERRLVADAQAEAASDLSTSKSENKRVYNTEALLALVQEWDVKQLPWIETLETCTAPLELENVHDDLKREVAFYNNSIAMVRVAKDRLKQDGVAATRTWPKSRTNSFMSRRRSRQSKSGRSRRRIGRCE